MSINSLLYKGSPTHIETWKKLGLDSLHVLDLVVNGHPLVFENADFTIPVNTYDGSNNLVTADVFSLNIHAIRVGHIIVLTIAAITHTATNTFNYFGFQLPTDFIPNSINSGLLLSTINSVVEANKFTITTTGQFRISKDLASTDFVSTDQFAQSQQTITYDNSN